MTLPFMKIDIVLPGEGSEEAPDKVVKARFQPADVESFNDAYHWGCIVKFKSGEILMVKETADMFEAMLSSYWRQVNEGLRRAQATPTILPIS
jgi:hypothetical protein